MSASTAPSNRFPGVNFIGVQNCDSIGELVEIEHGVTIVLGGGVTITDSTVIKAPVMIENGTLQDMTIINSSRILGGTQAYGIMTGGEMVSGTLNFCKFYGGEVLGGILTNCDIEGGIVLGGTLYHCKILPGAYVPENAGELWFKEIGPDFNWNLPHPATRRTGRNVEARTGSNALHAPSRTNVSSDHVSANNASPAEQFDEDPPVDYMDDITGELINKAYMAADGYTYDLATLQRITKDGWGRCPMTRIDFVESELKPNRKVQDMIDKWKAAHRVQ